MTSEPISTPMPSTPSTGQARSKESPSVLQERLFRLARYAFLLVPLVALGELIAHFAIVRGVPKDGDWRAARNFVAREKRDGDLVAAAPLWADPLARKYLHGLITLKDATRADAARYRRAFVTTIRNGTHPDFNGWTEERTERFGGVAVRVLRNPHPVTVLYDFVDHIRPPDASVYRVERGERRECAFRAGMRVEGGGLGQGALAGPERFNCGEGWNYVGRVIIEDMDHRPRACLWSHPVVDVPMRTVFHDVPVGTVLRGHHAIAYEAERGGDHGETGSPVTLVVRVGDREVGRDVHTDGEGWKEFRFDTRALAGRPQDVTFEVTFPQSGNRHYCFEGVTQ